MYLIALDHACHTYSCSLNMFWSCQPYTKSSTFMRCLSNPLPPCVVYQILHHLWCSTPLCLFIKHTMEKRDARKEQVLNSWTVQVSCNFDKIEQNPHLHCYKLALFLHSSFPWWQQSSCIKAYGLLVGLFPLTLFSYLDLPLAPRWRFFDSFTSFFFSVSLVPFKQEFCPVVLLSSRLFRS